ncbi:aminopeptidase P family protein [Aestuariimicrobium sp. p3-SID1156]|uniref:aminopeptidase P family protein n=1 Tax=Aestuariimicrobium sp. p3-SID1156 TaxID=2916038 RepID=UPI00223AE25D|nr:aminopeptidase P family protein [Aestuariimicrobium sp. p3-SID1156]MCT1459555.1 aminopeptidase P family protein [Aestuariimicrobium sp. p3-SID1156]
MSEEQPKLPNRQNPFSEAFREFIPTGWAPYPTELPQALPAASWTPERRRKLSQKFPEDRIVLPAGGLKVRANDTDYPYRPDTAFAYYSGLGGDREPDAVLVLEPSDNGHEPTLYFKPRAPRTDPEFYADARYGEMWVGQRESLDEMAALIGFPAAPISELDEHLAKNADAVQLRVLRLADAEVAARVDRVRREAGRSEQTEFDEELAVAVSEQRLVKDAFEVEEMQRACDATAEGFEAVVRDLPEAVRRGRGERWVEGIFGLYARHHGNAVGYDTIAAGADHANTLHWIRNDGDLREGDLLLMDAGVELDSLYTADITRTLPVSGTYSPAQRKVYQAVLDAQNAALAAAKPGVSFKEVHAAAIKVIAERLHEWGLLPVTPQESLSPEGGQHRRWMVHGTSHHLGLDVHDCAQARTENYREGVLEPGMIITVEPGIYFKATDLLVPEELRGIGVRIEDDIVITEDGNRILSDKLPRDPDEVEAWMAGLL